MGNKIHTDMNRARWPYLYLFLSFLLVKNSHCVKIIPIRSFFWFVFSVFSPNTEKYGHTVLRIWTLFTQWASSVRNLLSKKCFWNLVLKFQLLLPKTSFLGNFRVIYIYSTSTAGLRWLISGGTFSSLIFTLSQNCKLNKTIVPSNIRC